jgi:transmembrane and ubiquitin-like domain-containing protein
MSLVEGVGDEVTQFFIALVVIALALLAWWSTNISETPLVRTVLVLERRRVEVKIVLLFTFFFIFAEKF